MGLFKLWIEESKRWTHRKNLELRWESDYFPGQICLELKLYNSLLERIGPHKIISHWEENLSGLLSIFLSHTENVKQAEFQKVGLAVIQLWNA